MPISRLLVVAHVACCYRLHLAAPPGPSFRCRCRSVPSSYGTGKLTEGERLKRRWSAWARFSSNSGS